MRDKEVAEKKDYLTFKIGDVTYLPHYKDSKLFVGPGYPVHNDTIYTSTDLLEAGAKASMKHLWIRVEHSLGKVRGFRAEKPA